MVWSKLRTSTKTARTKVLNFSTALILFTYGLSGAAPIFLSQKAFAASPSDEYVATSGTDSPDCSNPGAPCQTIPYAISQADTGTIIHVSAGNYAENVNVNKAVTLEGAGAASTTIVATDGNSTPLTFSTNGATVSGFTITHNYTSAEKTVWNFNNNGVAFGQLTSGNTLENSTVSLSRNGVYINRSQNNIINNTITDNRTGINATNTIDGTHITGNTISDNWTLGFVYYDSGYSTNFSTVTMTGNTFDNNWYTQVEVKTAAGSTGTLDVTNNTFSDSPVTYTTSSDASLNEPGFAAQQPVELGGAATKPATSYPTLRIYSSGSVILKHTPKTLRVGTTEPYATIQAAVADASAGDTIAVDAGTYSGDINIPVNDLTIAGTGSVVLNLGSGYGINLDSPPLATTGFTMSGITVNASPSTTYALKAYKADGITLTDDTFNGGAGNTGGGADFNTTNDVTLNNVTATGFHKNGFAYTPQYVVTDTPASGIAFNGVTASNDGWAGIAFYTVGNDHSPSSIGGTANITGVTFSGNNTISNNAKGIQIEGDSDANETANNTPQWGITGSGSDPVDIGNTAFSGNGLDIINYQTNDMNALSATFAGQTGSQMSYSQRTALKTSGDIIDSATYPSFGTVNIFDASGYVNDPSQSNFTTPKYVRSHNSSDIAAQALVSKDAESVRFTYTQTDGGNVYTDVVGTQHIQAGQFPVPATGQQQWRGGVSAEVGTYTVTGEYKVGSNWYPVTGSATAYVLGNPTGSFVLPSAGSHYFRPSDNPLRIKADDANNSFRNVTFNVNSTNYTVNRADCDLREAGNYVICDVSSASNWSGLPEGTYTGTATLFNQASNHTAITSQSFTIDGTRPTISNFTITHTRSVYGSSVDVSADATDATSGIKNVTFYVTAPRAGDGVCDGNGTQLSSTTGSLSSGSTYTGTLDTSSLNGDYCLNAISEDNAANHSSTILHIKATFDNTAPADPTLVSPSNNAVVKGASITQSWSDTSGDVDHYIYESYNNSTATSLRFHGTYSATSKTATNVADTAYWWRVKAVDAAGNESGWSPLRKLTVDNTAPDVAITSPGSGSTLSFVNDGTVAVRGTVTDANPHHYYLHISGPGGYSSGPGTVNDTSSFTNQSLFSWNLSGLQSGTYTIDLEARDAAGGTSSSGNKDAGSVDTKTVIVDNTTPDAPSTNLPAGDYTGTQSVELSSSDGLSGLASIYYTTDGSDPTTSAARVSYPLDNSAPISVSSDETINAVAYDNAGNASTVSSFTYGIAPVISGEGSIGVTTNSITLVWTTNEPATSRVIYDTSSRATLGSSIDSGTGLETYGYQFTTPETDTSTKVTSHSVTITGLTPGTTYYFRTVSHGSPESVSTELSSITQVASTSGSSSSSIPTFVITPILTVGTTAGTVVNSVPNAGGAVLGATTNTPNTSNDNNGSGSNGGNVKGESTTKNNDNKSNSNFLALGWWWLPVLVILALIIGGLLRKADSTKKAN